MDIKITPTPETQRKTPPSDMSQVVFGSQMSDHMFLMEWDRGQGWHSASIEGYRPLELEPSCLIFHYGQQSFEGMKAYRSANNELQLFRPRSNFERLNRTAQRICLPEVDIDFAVKALEQLVSLDQAWVPKDHGTSLYIRPTLIATEAALGLKVSSKFLFFMITCPVGPYYAEGFNPVKIMTCEKYTRAAPGGTGEAKTGGNYAASNIAEKEAKEQGFAQVLWLDAVERRYVEEVGAMNIFFVMNDEIITPQLTGTILPGITRDSVLKLGRHWGLNMVERRISIDEVADGLKSGAIKEIFGCGTAAVISPVGALHHQGETYTVADGQTGPTAQRFFDAITGIQYSTAEDPFHWVHKINVDR